MSIAPELEQGLDSLAPYEVSGLPDAQAQKRSKELQYWKLCSIEDCRTHYARKGWVVTGPALSPYTAVEWSDFQSTKHATSLANYGKWASGEVFRAPTRFGPLLRAGGLHEIPIEQMVAYKWHLRPEIVRVVPELANVDVFLCEHGCITVGPRKRTFNTEASRQKHYNVMHKEIVGPTLIGRQLKEAQSMGMASIPPEYWAQVALIVKAALESPTPKPVIVKGGGDSD